MPLPLGGERPKSSESFWPGEKEARRLVVAVGVGGGEFSLLAIWKDVGVEVLVDEALERGGQDGESSGQILCLLKAISNLTL